MNRYEDAYFTCCLVFNGTIFETCSSIFESDSTGTGAVVDVVDGLMILKKSNSATSATSDFLDYDNELRRQLRSKDLQVHQH